MDRRPAALAIFVALVASTCGGSPTPSVVSPAASSSVHASVLGSSAVVDGRRYVIGGGRAAGLSVSDVVEIDTP